MSDFLLRFPWVLFRPVGFCCRRPGFWAGLVLGWVGPGMGFWAFVRDILGVWSHVFAPSRPGLGVFGLIGFRYQGWADGNASTAGKGQHDGVGASWHRAFLLAASFLVI